MTSTNEGICTPTQLADNRTSLPQRTPAKSTTGLFLNSQTYKTPTGRPHLLHFGGFNSPKTFTPGSVRSSSSSSSSRSLSSHGNTPRSCHYTPSGLRTPRGLSTKKCTPSPMSKDSTGSYSRLMIPKGRIAYNPFEIGLLETLGETLLSPNVFAQTSTPSSDGGSNQPFRWSIEHLAELQPVEIEEVSPSHLPELDLETEQKAQEAIESFFSKSCVVPSPWSDTSQQRTGHHLPQTPSTPDVFSPAAYMIAKSTREQVEAAVAALDDDHHENETKQDGEYYLREQEDQELEEDKDMSSSSLRRKLFFHGDRGTPLSPVRGRGQARQNVPMDFTGNSPNISPVRCFSNSQPDPHHGGCETPGSADHFSSSPISNKEKYTSPCLRRCSTAPDLMHSPEMSPIVSSSERKAGSTKAEDFSSPLCGPLIGTPSSELHSIKAMNHPLNSPGFSPIKHPERSNSCTDLSIVPKRTSGEKRKSPDHVQTSLVFVSDEEDIDDALEVGSIPDSNNDFSHHYTDGMDFETSPVQEEKPFTFSVGGESIPQSHCVRFASSTRADFTDVDIYGDSTDKSVDNAVTISQDTGYNTNSLQLSNPDYQFSGMFGNSQIANSIGNYNMISQQNTSSTSVIAHTDLTAQFGEMPISGGPNMDISEGYDSADELGTSSGVNSYSKRSSSNSSLILKEKFPPDQLCDAPSDEEYDYDVSNNGKPKGLASWDEGHILQRARQMLAQLDETNEQNKPTKRIVRKTARKKDTKENFEATRNPAAMATPHRQQFQKLGVVPNEPSSKNIFASEVATKVLERAGADVARYCRHSEQTVGSIGRSISMPESFNGTSQQL